MADLADLELGMTKRDGIEACLRCACAREVLKALAVQNLVDRPQAVRALGMIGRRCMIEARRMADEEGGHELCFSYVRQRTRLQRVPEGGISDVWFREAKVQFTRWIRSGTCGLIGPLALKYAYSASTS
jgi:hypothetical protein